MGKQVERCGCIMHMDSSVGGLSVADAPIQVHLAVALHSDIESWAHFDTARGWKGVEKCAECNTSFLFYLEHTIAAI